MPDEMILGCAASVFTSCSYYLMELRSFEQRLTLKSASFHSLVADASSQEPKFHKNPIYCATGGETMALPNEKAEAFVKDLKQLVTKHYGSLDKSEVEPFGMHVRKALPTMAANSTGSVTTTVTLTIPLDKDDPDSDD